MSDTPETDACQKLKDIIGDEYVSVEFARKLERKRDEYRDQADALVDRLGATQDRMIDAERQRDEVSNAFVMAVDEMVQAQSQLRDVERERDTYREQADALVDRLGQTQERMIDAERQRDEARHALRTGGMLDIIDRAGHERAAAIRERDEARDTVATMEIRHAAAMFHAQRVVDDANQLKEQRDMLAEALRMITTFDYTDLQCDNGHGPRSVATEALQSLTQTKQ